MCIHIDLYAYQLSRSLESDSAAPWTVAHQALAVHHQLPELTQTHVHQVGDAIQPPHTSIFLSHLKISCKHDNLP